MIDQQRAGDVRRVGKAVEGAGRYARIAQTLGKQANRPGRIRRTLDDDGITGDQRRGCRPCSQRERKVEGCDDCPYPVGFHDRPVAHRAVRHRVVGQLLAEPVLLFEDVAVDIEEIGGLLDFADGLHPVLADFERQRGADIVHPFLDQLAGLAQHPVPDCRRRVTPSRKGACRRCNGRIDVLGGRFWNARQDPVGIDRTQVIKKIAIDHVLAVDQMSVHLAETAAHARHRRIKPLVHLGRRIEHG